MRILFVSGIGGDTQRYRCLHHQEQLALHGIESCLLQPADPALYSEAALCDLAILHRVPWSPLIADAVTLLHGRGTAVVFETDDLIFAPELFGRIAYINSLSPDQAQRFRADLDGQVQTFAACDCVLTTTAFLAQAATERGKTAYIQRNACSAGMLAAAEEAYSLRRQRLAAQAAQRQAGEPPPVVLGYFSGSSSHNRDFATIAPVLAELLQRHPQLRLQIGGPLELPLSLLAYQARIRRIPFVAWQELPTFIAQVDINLAPLEVDNPFCQAKSEIKFSEAALLGVPTVSSPTEAFAYAIQDGQDGLLAAGPAQWSAALERLIAQPETALALGEAARRKVYTAYSPAQAAQSLVATLETIRRNHAPAPSDPQQLLHWLAQRTTAHIRQGQNELEQLQRQAEQLRRTLAGWEAGAANPGAAFWRAGLQSSQERHQATLREVLKRLAHWGARSGQ